MKGRPQTYRSTIEKAAAQRAAQKRYMENKRSQDLEKQAIIKALMEENVKLKKQFRAAESDFFTLFPLLCKHDRITAKKLWDGVSTSSTDVNDTKNTSNEVSQFPVICGCNES